MPLLSQHRLVVVLVASLVLAASLARAQVLPTVPPVQVGLPPAVGAAAGQSPPSIALPSPPALSAAAPAHSVHRVPSGAVQPMEEDEEC